MTKEILQLISSKLAQGNLLSFADLVSFKPIHQDELQSCFNWYEKVINLLWLDELLISTKHFEEIIIHSNKNLQIKGSVNKLNQKLDISERELALGYEILAINNKVQWNYNSPVVSFQYTSNKNIYRLTLLHYSATPNKYSKLFIRSTPCETLSLSSFAEKGYQSYISNSIAAKKNIVISGSNSSGKTTLLKSLIKLIPKDQHLVILEDFNELITSTENVTTLIENKLSPSKSLANYCSYSLRMSVDRLVIGEVRSAEIVPFLLAINTGTEGVFTTIHANSARDTIDRLALLFSLYSAQSQINHNNVEKMICQSIDIIIYLKNKKVDHIIELCGFSDGRPLYKNITSI